MPHLAVSAISAARTLALKEADVAGSGRSRCAHRPAPAQPYYHSWHSYQATPPSVHNSLSEHNNIIHFSASTTDVGIAFDKEPILLSIDYYPPRENRQTILQYRKPVIYPSRKKQVRVPRCAQMCMYSVPCE